MPRLTRERMLIAAVALGVAATTSAATAASARADHDDGQIVFRRFFDLERTTGALFMVNPNGSGDRQLTRPLPGGVDDNPNWAPDGSRIVFTRQPAGDDGDQQRAFWTVKPDGSNARLLVPGCAAAGNCLGFEQIGNPLYSPDGRRIAYGWAAGDVRDDIGSIQFSEVYLMDADGRHPRPLTSFTRDVPYSGDTGPDAWSPDGRHLLITRSLSSISEPAGGVALFIINADGTGARRLTPWALRAGGARADWSSDGRLIVFHTVPEDDIGGDIYTIRPDGSGLRRLTRFPQDTTRLGELGFSADGKQIVYTMGGLVNNRDMFTMRTNGTHVEQITATDVSENNPDWGPGRTR